MNLYFIAAAILTLGVGFAHSWLGERYILMRLIRSPNISQLFRNDVFVKRTLRLAWHVTTVAWCGLAALLLASALSPPDAFALVLSKIVAATFLTSSIFALIASRGQHLSWVVFLVIAGLAWLGGR